MNTTTKLRGGSAVLKTLRERGSMPYVEMEALAKGMTGDLSRARDTLEELVRRGAFAVQDGTAHATFSGDYALVLRRLAEGAVLARTLADEMDRSMMYVMSILEDLESMGLARRYPRIKGKRYWVSSSVDVGRTLVDLHRDAIVAMTSEEPM